MQIHPFASRYVIYYGAVRLGFWASFVLSILNISIGDNSVYFFMLIPFADFSFYRHLTEIRFSTKTAVPLALLLASCICQFALTGKVIYAIKPLFLFSTISYIVFLYKTRYEWFSAVYFFICFSVAFGCIQIAAAYAGISGPIQPGNLASLIWGKYAILCRNNFDDGVLLPYRVSGFSKEPGFFSSLLIMAIAVIVSDLKASKRTRRLLVGVMLVGSLISFSKITAVFLLPSIIGYAASRFLPLHKIRSSIGLFIIIGLSVIFVRAIYSVTHFELLTYLAPWETETYLHRSIGYFLLGQYEWPQLWNHFFFGGITEGLPETITAFPFLSNLRYVKIMPSIVFFSSGFAYLILQYGIVMFLGFGWYIDRLKIKLLPILLFVFGTGSVNPLALENTVILGYVYILLNSQLFSSRHTNLGQKAPSTARFHLQPSAVAVAQNE